MTKEDRLYIITKVSGLPNPSMIKLANTIDSFILDELQYAGLKASFCDVSKEFSKVLAAYDFDGYSPSLRIKNYIKHYSANPQIASMQHYEINDSVSYIGEYYDGEPTCKYRKPGRYEIQPITPIISSQKSDMGSVCYHEHKDLKEDKE